MKLLPACCLSLSLLRPALGGLLLAALAGPAASHPALAGRPPASQCRVASGRGDAASRVDFTFSGAGHPSAQVHLRDVYPEVPAPFACVYHDGSVFGVQGPIVELRTSKQGPGLWSFHLLLPGTPTMASLPVASPQPALVYSGGEPGQQAFYPQLVFPPLKRGTLRVQFLPAPKGRLRGTFAGTLVSDKGEFVTVSNGSFDLPRRPDVN